MISPTLQTLFPLYSTSTFWNRINTSMGYYYEMQSTGVIPDNIKVCFRPFLIPGKESEFQIDSQTYLSQVTDISVYILMKDNKATEAAMSNKITQWSSNVMKTRLTFSTRIVIDVFFEQCFKDFASKFKNTNDVLEDYMKFQRKYIEITQIELEKLCEQNADNLSKLSALGF